MMAEGVWFLLALAVAGLAAIWSQRRGAPAFGAFAALLIIGGAAQLALTQPLWFPALRLRPNGLPDLAMWAILAVQALAVLGWFWHRGFRHGLCPLARRYGTGRILLLLLLSSGFCVSVMGYFSPDATALRLSPWLAHVAVGGGLIALHLATVTVLLSVAPPVRGTHALSPLAPAFVTVVAGLALSFLAFEGQPHVEDEVAYVFQARTFAAGALTAPLPPAAAMPGLEYYLFDSDGGRWFATTPPGWPAVLALGEAIGAPWIINPALAGLSVLLAHAIVRRRAGRDAADWVAIVMGSSPWLISAAATLMTHTLTLALVLAAWVWVLRAGDRGRSPWAPLFLAGLALGWVFTTRILDGLIVGTLTGMWVLLEGRTGAARAALRAAVYGLGCLATGSLALIYNRLFTGRPLQSPLDHYLAREWGTEGNAYGFGDNIGPPGGWGALDLWRGHSPLEAVINTTSNIVSLQVEFLGWPTGSLVLVFALLIWGFRRPAIRDPFARAMIVLCASVMLAMFFYWYGDTYHIGPRYWFIMAFPLVYLSWLGYRAIVARAGDKPEAERRGMSVVLILCLFGVAVFLPWRGVMKFHGYNDYTSSVPRMAATGVFGDAVVLVKTPMNVGSALALNDPLLRPGRPIYLRDTGTLDEAALAAAFPGRQVIHYDDPG